MNRWTYILFLTLFSLTTGCSGMGGGASPLGGSDGGLAPPGLGSSGAGLGGGPGAGSGAGPGQPGQEGIPGGAGGAGAPNQPGQEGIPRIRPNMVIVDVLRPTTGGKAMFRLNDNTDGGGGTLENPPDTKPKIFVKTTNPNFDFPSVSTDDQWEAMVSYYPSHGDAETCLTHLEIYATYEENNISYHSNTYTSDSCPGEESPPKITLQLTALPPSHVNGDAVTNPVNAVFQ